MSLGYLASSLAVEVFLRGLEPGLGVGLLLEQRSVVFERLALVGVVRVVADLLEPRLHGFGGDLLLLALAFDDLGQQPFLAAVLLAHFVELLLERGELGFERFDGIALGGEVAGDEERRRDEVGLEAALALLEVVRLGPDEFACPCS